VEARLDGVRQRAAWGRIGEYPLLDLPRRRRAGYVCRLAVHKEWGWGVKVRTQSAEHPIVPHIDPRQSILKTAVAEGITHRAREYPITAHSYKSPGRALS
jgi:hypothetical protein